MITYIAGPMSGLPNFNRAAFHKAAAELVEHGRTVLNPATLPDGLSERAYMDIGIAMLRSAEAIYLLDGWEQSAGARAEAALAEKLGLRVYYQTLPRGESNNAQPAEPVAWIVHARSCDQLTKDADYVAQAAALGDIHSTPLYIAPPAAAVPVVPDAHYWCLRELYHAQEKRLFKMAQRIKGPTFGKYSHSPSQAIDVLEEAIFGEHDACRAEMLKGSRQ